MRGGAIHLYISGTERPKGGVEGLAAHAVIEGARESAGTLGNRNITPHCAYGAQTILEGPEHEGIAIVSFPTRAEAEEWYHSPEYTDARQHRMRGGDYSVTIVDGF